MEIFGLWSLNFRFYKMISKEICVLEQNSIFDWGLYVICYVVQVDHLKFFDINI